MITVYDPGISVVLFKMVKRVAGVSQRYAGIRRQIDLTPLLGDGGSVRTSKDLLQAGGFTISFPDQPDSQARDTLYAVIEPMDMIEIRMARNPGQYASGKLPLIMRGFVSTINRPEAMGADGTPQRFIVVTGLDFTKLWMINAIYWAAIYATDQDLLSFWNVGASLGMPAGTYTANDFVTGMVGVMNKKMASLQAFSTVAQFTAAASVPQGMITPNLMSALGEGTYWDIMTAFADTAWNEIFVQDLETGPQVVFRPLPYKDTSGNFIMPGAADPGSYAIDDSLVVSLNPSRSDDNVANVFSVNSDPSNLLSGGSNMLAALADGNTYQQNHQNNFPGLYGTKVMSATSNMVGAVPSAAADPVDASGNDADTVSWWVTRYQQLQLLNQDNSVFEDGTATIQGHENVRPGIYLKVTRGSLVSTSYMNQVSHNYIPFGNWTCDVNLIRGDGFLVRDKYAGNAFWAEGRRDVYGS